MSFTMVDGKGKTLHERLAQAAAWPLICSDSQQTQKSQRKIILLCGSFFQLNQYSVKLNEIRRGAYDPADRLTTGAWLDEWFNTFYRPTVKSSTAATTYGNIRRLLKDANLPTRGIYALRHTFATNWVRKSPDVVALARIIGHSDPAFTYKTYCHTDATAMNEDMAMMEQFLQR